MLLNCLFVGLGGFAGSVLRYLVTLIPTDASAVFPVKTLAVNVLGSFVIGVAFALTARQGWAADSPQLLLLKVGFCGGFTTLSTVALESNQLIASGNAPLAVAYACVSVILSVLAVFAGQAVVR
jgi:fluoride exporter